MPRKGMKSLLFSPRPSSSSSSSSSSHQISSPSRFGFSPSRPSFYESVMDRTLDMAAPIITQWDPESETAVDSTSLLFQQQNRREAKDFIKLVTNLHRAMQFLVTENSSSQKLVRAQNLMQVAMKRLQKEFYQLLSTNRAHLDSQSMISARFSSCSFADQSSSLSDYEEEEEDGRIDNGSLSEVEADVSTVVMADLRLIAECMISSGYGNECMKICKIIRQSVVDETIYRHGVEKLSSSQLRQMDWESVDFRIQKWLDAVGTAVNTLFAGERILCDNVFAASDSIRDSCFAEITKRGAMILFEFPANIVRNSTHSPEKIFRSLDMYAAISDQWRDIASIFSSASVSDIVSQALASLVRLGEHVRSSIDDLESAISKDSSKPSFAGGDIHPLTIDVMNYLSVLSEYINSLADIYAESSPEWDETQMPAISLKMARLIRVLLCKLDGQERQLRDSSVACSFLADNLGYVVAQVRMSNLKYLLGDDWLSSHEDRVRHFRVKL